MLFDSVEENPKIVDLNSVSLGLPTLLLMENAGREVAKEIIKRRKVEKEKVIVFCGTGNNGGDGFVAARHLANYGAKVTVVLLGKPEEIKTEEAKTNWKIIQNMVFTVKKQFLRDTSNLKEIKELIKEAKVVVDAILGTGLEGKLREPYFSLVKLINESEIFKVSVDTPTGLNPETGEIHGIAVNADLTVTMGKMKKGFKGKEEVTGEVVVAEIGSPKEAEVIAGRGDLMHVIKPRNIYSHKGDFGRVLIIGGSKYYSGAPALAALAALNTGVDLTFIFCPEEISNVLRGYSPNLIVRSYPGSYLNKESINHLKKLLDESDSVIIGPGLGLEREIKEAAVKILKEAVRKNKPVLVDADGLKALKGKLQQIRSEKIVLTPHSGEYKYLFGEELPEQRNLEERVLKVKETAKKHGLTLTVKGHVDIVSNGEKVKVNFTGNPGMTVGGTGDVLSGIIAAFLSWKTSTFRAAVAGTYLCGLAGDKAFEKKGYQLTATDVIKEIPYILKNQQIKA